MIGNLARATVVAALVMSVFGTRPASAQTEDEQVQANLEDNAPILGELEEDDFGGLMMDMQSIQQAWEDQACLDAQGEVATTFEGCALGQGQNRPGFVTYHWQPGAQMKVYMRPRMFTVIRWPSSVKLLTPFVGDDVSFEAANDAQLDNLVWVRAKNYNIDTDLKVRDENGNVYSFILLSKPENYASLTASEVSVVPHKTLAEKMAAAVPASKKEVEDDTAEKGKVVESVTPLDSAETDADRKARAEYLRQLNYNFANSVCDREAFDIKAPDEESAKALSPEHVCTDGKFTIFDFGSRADEMKRAPVFQVIDKIDVNIPSYKWTGKNSQMLIVEVSGDFSMIFGKKYMCFFSKTDKPAPNIVTIGGV